MDHHVGQLASYRFFAGVMEVVLHEVVAHAFGDDVTAGVDVNHDGVAVVLQRHRSGDVVEFNRLQCLVVVCAVNVDGGLLVALRTGTVSGVELAPAQGAVLALVVPVGGGLGGGKGGYAKCQGNKNRKTHRSLLANEKR